MCLTHPSRLSKISCYCMSPLSVWRTDVCKYHNMPWKYDIILCSVSKSSSKDMEYLSNIFLRSTSYRILVEHQMNLMLKLNQTNGMILQSLNIMNNFKKLKCQRYGCVFKSSNVIGICKEYKDCNLYVRFVAKVVLVWHCMVSLNSFLRS